MAILVTGSTGTIGSLVVSQLAERGAKVRALSRNPAKARFPDGVIPVKGELMDVDFTRAALAEIDTLCLSNANTSDELTQAMIALNLARDMGIKGIVYISVLNADEFPDVPHFALKQATERMIVNCDIPATVLRGAYFFQNDASHKEAVLDKGVYPVPIGGVGISMVDTRDIADVAAMTLLRRESAAESLPHETIDLCGPDVLTGVAVAAIWSEVIRRPISYAGDDLAAFEPQLKTLYPSSWLAYDMMVMLRGYQRQGMLAKPGSVERLIEQLGRPLRTYRSFAQETMKQWLASSR